MDAELRRSLLEVCVLSAIKREDSYSYRIIKNMKPYVEVTETELYPILKKLEADGQLKNYATEHNGRPRKYYRITQKGKDRIKEFQKEWDEMLSIYRFVIKEEKDDE
ncbi:MAG: PadR family transcriptional regulator [Eubacterium sp.]|nr:PadR family transcriptional regulator [Eubacterium sp.]